MRSADYCYCWRPVLKLPSIRAFTVFACLIVALPIAITAEANPDQTLTIINSKAFQALRNFDYAKALGLWKTSAEKGNADAQYQLGRMYQLGQGVEQSDRVAKSWYRLAAAGGNNVAKSRLSRMK